MDPDSLQTPTDTGTRLHIVAIIVGHKTGPGTTLRYARLRTIPDSLCRSAGTPLHMLEAQDYSNPQPTQSQETLQDYNQSLGTAQYSTPYFVSKEELPQMTCNSLKTVQVSRLGASGQSEHI